MSLLPQGQDLEPCVAAVLELVKSGRCNLSHRLPDPARTQSWSRLRQRLRGEHQDGNNRECDRDLMNVTGIWQVALAHFANSRQTSPDVR
jgi:hypothetical protein